MAVFTYDILWKAILEELFSEFIEFFSPDLFNKINWSKQVEFLNKETADLYPEPGNMKDNKTVDFLAKVALLSGEQFCVLIHIEVQGYQDREFAHRMYIAYYRLRDKYNKPVFPLAIFTEDNKHYHPSIYEEQFEGGSLVFRYPFHKILDYNEEALKMSNNPIAIVILITLLHLKKIVKDKKVPIGDIFLSKVELARLLLAKKIPVIKIRILMTFLKNYIRFDSEQINRNFEEELNKLTNKSAAMGIEELVIDLAEKRGEKKGEKKGEAKNKEQVVKNLILQFGFTDEQAAKATQSSIRFVKGVRVSLNV